MKGRTLLNLQGEGTNPNPNPIPNPNRKRDRNPSPSPSPNRSPNPDPSPHQAREARELEESGRAALLLDFVGFAQGEVRVGKSR